MCLINKGLVSSVKPSKGPGCVSQQVPRPAEFWTRSGWRTYHMGKRVRVQSAVHHVILQSSHHFFFQLKTFGRKRKTVELYFRSATDRNLWNCLKSLKRRTDKIKLQRIHLGTGHSFGLERPSNQKLMLLKSLRAFEPFMCISTAAIKSFTRFINALRFILSSLHN